MKLYRVKLRGMLGTACGTAYGNPYVVAEDPTAAVRIVQEYLNARDLGFTQERELDSVELLAEEGEYPDCCTQIFLNAVRPPRIGTPACPNCGAFTVIAASDGGALQCLTCNKVFPRQSSTTSKTVEKEEGEKL